MIVAADEGGSDDVGAIVGGVFGALFGLVFLLVVVFFLMRVFKPDEMKDIQDIFLDKINIKSPVKSRESTKGECRGCMKKNFVLKKADIDGIYLLSGFLSK